MHTASRRPYQPRQSDLLHYILRTPPDQLPIPSIACIG